MLLLQDSNAHDLSSDDKPFYPHETMLLKLGVSECGEWKFIFEPEPRPVIAVTSGTQEETQGGQRLLPESSVGLRFSAPPPLLRTPTPVLLTG